MRYQPIPKPTRKRMNPRDKEAPVIKKVRAAVLERDGGCRVGQWLIHGPLCLGDLQWCHMSGKRRSQTRRMAPADRHSTAWTVMLCALHAELEERKLLTTEYLTDKGADGPMKFTFVRTGKQIEEAA